jgi:hypothetical protein
MNKAEPSRIVSVMLALGAVLLMALWLGYECAGEALVTAMREGAALPSFLHALQARVQALPEAYAYDRMDALMSMAVRAGALLWTLLAVALLRRRSSADPMLTPRQRLLLWGGVLLILLAPWIWLKLIGLALTLGCGLRRERELTLSSDRVRLVWYAVFLAAYVSAPYWVFPDTLWLRLLVLAALLVLGWWWAALPARALCLRIPAAHWGLPVVVLLVAAFHAWPAGAGIAWKGDEDYHMMQMAYLCENMPPVWMVTLWGLAMLVTSGAVLTPVRHASWMATVAVLGGLGYPHLLGSLARYPYLLRWVEAAPVQLLHPFPTLFYDEAIIRSASVFCSAGLAAAVYLSMRPQRMRGALVAVAALTIPILQFYGSLVCLETPVLTLLGIAALRASALMQDDAKRVRGDLGWLALVLAGFTKETLLPVLAAFVAGRVWVCLRKGRRWREGWTGELRLVVALCLPIAIYLIFRTSEAVFRGHPGLWHQWFHPAVWSVLFGSLWEQLGCLGLLAVAGTVALRREYANVLVWLWGWVAAVALFTMGDVAEYVGYSRYNLFLVPPLLAIVVLWLARLRSAHWLVVLWMVGNLILSPLLSSGARRASWGTPVAQVGERFYPYPEALDWLNTNRGGDRILFAGFDYPYYLEFYFAQMQWRPDYLTDLEAATLEEAGEKAMQAKCSVILYHVLDAKGPIPPEVAGYQLKRIFTRAECTLIAYIKQDPHFHEAQ